MKELDQQQILECQNIILNYIQGHVPILGTKAALLEKSIDLGAKCSTIYKLIPIREHDIQLRRILLSLNYNEEQIVAKIKEHDNLFSLIQDIAKTKKDKYLRKFLEMADKAKPPFNWLALLLSTTVGSVLLGIFFQYNQTYFNAMVNWLNDQLPLVRKFFTSIFTMIKNIPLFLASFNTIILGISWYRIITNQSISNEEKTVALTFKTITHGLAIMGYVLSFLSAGIVSIPIAVIFVLRSFMETGYGIYDLVRNAIDHASPIENNGHPWSNEAEKVKKQIYGDLKVRCAWIKIASATIIAGAVALMFFCPPSLLLTVSCLTFIWMLDLTHSVWINNLKSHADSYVTTKLGGLKGYLTSDADLCPDKIYCEQQELKNQSLNEENQCLKAENQCLKAENQHLKAENQHLKAENQTLNEERQQSQYQPRFFSAQNDSNDSNAVEHDNIDTEIKSNNL